MGIFKVVMHIDCFWASQLRVGSFLFRHLVVRDLVDDHILGKVKDELQSTYTHPILLH